MPRTALLHFRQDIARARAIVSHATALPRTTAVERLLYDDLNRSGWMFAVGALDAYFCDAYTDLIAVAASSKNRQPTIRLPEWFYEIRFPLRAILEPYQNTNWRWRMAARKMMERENVIALATVEKLFNRFFPIGRKFFRDLLDDWINRPDATVRLFGVSTAQYVAMNVAAKHLARQQAIRQFEDRFREIFQRRHDCIHNCDRPRVSPQLLASSGTVVKVIQDIEYLVSRCDEHITGEFRQFLAAAGCSATTITLAGY